LIVDLKVARRETTRIDSFKYDPFGRRIYKSSSAGTSVYAYDGDNLMEETSSTGAVVARYEQTQNIDEPTKRVIFEGVCDSITG
jgi:hypothetical protein